MDDHPLAGRERGNVENRGEGRVRASVRLVLLAGPLEQRPVVEESSRSGSRGVGRGEGNLRRATSVLRMMEIGEEPLGLHLQHGVTLATSLLETGTVEDRYPPAFVVDHSLSL